MAVPGSNSEVVIEIPKWAAPVILGLCITIASIALQAFAEDRAAELDKEHERLSSSRFQTIEAKMQISDLERAANTQAIKEIANAVKNTGETAGDNHDLLIRITERMNIDVPADG